MGAFTSTTRWVLTEVVGLAVGLSLVVWLDRQDLLDSDPPRSLAGSIFFAAFIMATPAFLTFRDGRRLRQQARRAVGPRYLTDRAELERALTTGEPPADPTLDGPLLAAIKVVRRVDERPTGWETFGLVAGLLVVASFVAAAVGMPWGLLAFLMLPLIASGELRRRDRVRRLARLQAAIEERTVPGPVDPDALTYADLRSD